MVEKPSQLKNQEEIKMPTVKKDVKLLSVYQVLAAVDCSGHTEKKGKFTYLSWTWAWALVKSKFPTATFQKHIFTDNQNNVLPFMRDTKGYTFVQTSVTIDDQTMSEIFPVLDHKNQAVQHPNAFQVNTALQRCLVKTLAFFGLGLNIYAGEDLPIMDEVEQNMAIKERMIKAFKDSKTIEDIDHAWRVNIKDYNTLPKQEKSEVLNQFKQYKTPFIKDVKPDPKEDKAA